jgi:hypothetical protein
MTLVISTDDYRVQHDREVHLATAAERNQLRVWLNIDGHRTNGEPHYLAAAMTPKMAREIAADLIAHADLTDP